MIVPPAPIVPGHENQRVVPVRTRANCVRYGRDPMRTAQFVAVWRMRVIRGAQLRHYPRDGRQCLVRDVVEHPAFGADEVVEVGAFRDVRDVVRRRPEVLTYSVIRRVIAPGYRGRIERVEERRHVQARGSLRFCSRIGGPHVDVKDLRRSQTTGRALLLSRVAGKRVRISTLRRNQVDVCGKRRPHIHLEHLIRQGEPLPQRPIVLRVRLAHVHVVRVGGLRSILMIEAVHLATIVVGHESVVRVVRVDRRLEPRLF